MQVQQYIQIPSSLFGFQNTATTVDRTRSGRDVYLLYGDIQRPEEPPYCPSCGCPMHKHGIRQVTLRHLCFGAYLTAVRFIRYRYRCPKCSHTEMEDILFKAEGHNITGELLQFTKDLLAYGFTNKEVAELTGLGKNTVKEIDLQRLKDKYTVDGKTLKKPERQARILAIDEFKLHDGHKYATHIIDLETGHILWIAHGKKKQVVYDFIDHVGQEWMDSVEAIACDMNSDFQEAFEERCPHIQPVFDRFHIVKNFNDKVVSAIRKDEQKRLIEEGDQNAAAALKKTKYILTASRETLLRKDEEAAAGKVIDGGGEIFPRPEVTRKPDHMQRYEALLQQNQLFFTLDIIKDKLAKAYQQTDEAAMAKDISEIMDICEATENSHLLWFRRLLDSHFEGIIAHATFKVSSGKIEGINKSRPFDARDTDIPTMTTSSLNSLMPAVNPMRETPHPTTFVIEP